MKAIFSKQFHFQLKWNQVESERRDNSNNSSPTISTQLGQGFKPF